MSSLFVYGCMIQDKKLIWIPLTIPIPNPDKKTIFANNINTESHESRR